MPRQKKVEDKKKSRKPKEEEIEDEIIEEEIEEKPKKKTSKSKSKKNKKVDEEDELSDLDVGDEVDEDIESGMDGDDNDEIVSSGKAKSIKPEKKVIDPNTKIGSLKTDDILSYLIQIGTDTLNPRLRSGAINLLKELKGRRRRQPNFQKPMYGRGFSRGRGFSHGGHYGGPHRMMPPPHQVRMTAQHQRSTQSVPNDLYDEVDE